MKRFLSTLLMICLLISLFPVAASAAGDFNISVKFIDEGNVEIASLSKQLSLEADTTYTFLSFVPTGYELLSSEVNGDTSFNEVKKTFSGDDATYTLNPGAVAKTEAFTIVLKVKELTGVVIDETNFPDASFRDFVNVSFDTIKDDDVLTNDELAQAKIINKPSSGFTSLQGIAFFTSLEELDCSGNSITSLDLSANVALRKLDCSNMATLTSLNISGLSSLTSLDCSGCGLTALSINSSSVLETLVHDKGPTNPEANPREYQDGSYLLRFDAAVEVSHLPVWGEGVVTKEAKCYEVGERTYTCSLCDRTKTEEIPKIDHFMDDGTVTTEPTETTDGVRTYKCKYAGCTYTETEVIPKTTVTGVRITAENFYDPNFLEYVKTFDTGTPDGFLSATELTAVTEINVSGKGIVSLRGIEHFINLEKLDCSNNSLSALDLSANTKLKTLNCENNSLTALDLSKNTALTTLNCGKNQIAKLDLSKNTALSSLDCTSNKLTALDLSKNTALITVLCPQNSLASLNVAACTNLQTLNCRVNKLTALNITKNTNLKYLNCSGNTIKTLNIDKNATFVNLVHTKDKTTASGIDSFVDGAIVLGYDSTTAVTHLPKWDKGKLDPKPDCSTETPGTMTYTCQYDKCGKKKTVSVPFEHKWKSTGIYNPAPTETLPGKLIYECEVCHTPKIVEVAALSEGIPVDAAHFPDEVFLNYVKTNIDTDASLRLSQQEIEVVKNLDLHGMEIKNLKGIEHFTDLEELNVSGCKMSSLDLSKNVKLTSLKCDNVEMTALNLTANDKLTELFCSHCKLTKLDISQCVALTTLICYDNSITSLDLSRLLSLELLDCAKNKLTALNISANKSLSAVDCSENPLSTLTINSNASLMKLNCRSTSLSSIDISGCPALKVLDVAVTKIKTLDFSSNPALGNTYKDGKKDSVTSPVTADCYWIESVPFTSDRLAKLPYGLSPSGTALYAQMLCVDPSVKLSADSFATIVSRSLFLKGNVGLNFYVVVPDDFEISGKAHAELNGTSLDFPTPNANGEYLFTQYVAAKEMRDNVVFKIFDSDGNLFPMHLNDGTDVSTGYNFSVQKYFDLAHASTSNTLLLTLLDRMSDYGYFAQLNFKYNDAGVTVTGEMLSEINGVSVDSVKSYEPKITGSYDGGVTHNGSSLILRSETTIRHYFKLTKGQIGDYTFTVGGNKVTPVEKDGEYYVDIPHISAKDLDNSFTLQVKNKSGKVVASIENYSALSFVYTVLKSGGKGDQNLVNLVKGLYNYNKAAEAYFASRS